jgi:hypothetical protein
MCRKAEYFVEYTRTSGRDQFNLVYLVGEGRTSTTAAILAASCIKPNWRRFIRSELSGTLEGESTCSNNSARYNEPSPSLSQHMNLPEGSIRVDRGGRHTLGITEQSHIS